MLYPVYVHKDDDSAYGATVPDFPGCFSAADELQDLPRMVQEAIEVYCEGEEMEIPEPADISALEGEVAYTDGYWMYIDVDLEALNTKKERINLSVPVNKLREIDAHVAAVHTNRSGFMVEAALERVRVYRTSDGDISGQVKAAAKVKSKRAASKAPAKKKKSG